MNSLNRVAGCVVVIASTLSMSACLIRPDGNRGRVDDAHPQVSGDRNGSQHDATDRHCNSDEERRGDQCRDVDHR